MNSGGFAFAATLWGVTPQAQNTGSSSSLTTTGSPKSGLERFLTPICRGNPIWIGAPWTRYRDVTCIARMASAGRNGRIETTSFPENRGVGLVSIEVTVHRHVQALFVMPDPQPSLNESLLEGEGAADRERHQIIPPERQKIGRFLSNDSVPEHLILRSIRPDVHIDAQRRKDWIARIGDGEDRAWLGVHLAEQQELAGPVSRQNCQICLHAARGETRRLPRITAAANSARGASRDRWGTRGRNGI